MFPASVVGGPLVCAPERLLPRVITYTGMRQNYCSLLLYFDFIQNHLCEIFWYFTPTHYNISKVLILVKGNLSYYILLSV